MTEITEEMWKLVEARVGKMPPHMKLSIGNSSFTKDEILESVKRRDKTGELIASIELNYLKALKGL